jgi:hypothetical protein
MKEWSAALSEPEVVEVAEAGLFGMIEVMKEKGEDFSADLMINAALHILSAWVASSQATSSAAERESDIRDLLELLSGCIEYHRTARWLPDPDRADH